MLLIIPSHLAEDISDGQRNKEQGHGNNAKSHAHVVTPQALFAGVELLRLIAVAVITAAIPPAPGNLARTSAAQLWSACYLSVIANYGHKNSTGVPIIVGCWTMW